MKTLNDVLMLDRTLIGLDLETTDLNPAFARIVELGLEIMTPGKPTREFRTLVNPGIPIPKGASDVHGLTDGMVADAQTFEQLGPNLLGGFENVDFVGYNLRFDLRVLAAEFKRLTGEMWSYDGAYLLDAYRVWQLVEGRSLEDACQHWLGQAKDPREPVFGSARGEGREGAHSALWDAKQSTRILAAQLEEHSTLPRTPQGIHALCWPGWFDGEGKLRWKDGQVCFAFGEHRDRPLQRIPRGYLAWILKKDFSDAVKAACKDALNGVYPSPKDD